MEFFSSLKQTAINFLEPYKMKGPATYAAAQQAIGAILIADGFFGINNPFGYKKRSGIFGTISGIVLGIIFMFIPTIFENLSGLNDMTATTQATVVSVGSPNYTKSSKGHTSSVCTLIASFIVNGQEYSNQSPGSSSEHCAMYPGQMITINYNPANPHSWLYGARTIGYFFKVFFWTGVFVLISSAITFFIRLFSIIFGWKLLRAGRKNAASLPEGTNLQTMIAEIKQNFTSSIFGFGGTRSGYMPGTLPPTQGPMNSNM